MKVYKDHKKESNATVYKKLHKMLYAKCDYCRFHRGCNASNNKNKENWKQNRKTQYKNVNMF